jgi:tetratricopeptide (TPR) repeat protein
MSEFANSLYQQGLKAAKEGRPQDAIALFSRALEVKPDFQEALKARGDVRWNSLDINGAIDDIKAHSEMVAESFMSVAYEYEQRAERRLRLGDKEGAKEFYRLALKHLGTFEEL